MLYVRVYMGPLGTWDDGSDGISGMTIKVMSWCIGDDSKDWIPQEVET